MWKCSEAFNDPEAVCRFLNTLDETIAKPIITATSCGGDDYWTVFYLEPKEIDDPTLAADRWMGRRE